MLHMPFVKRTIYSNLCRLILVVAGLNLTACGGGGGGGGSSSVQSDEVYEINDPRTLSKAMSFEGAEKLDHSIPSSGTTSDRELDAPSELALTNNSNSPLNIDVPLEDQDSRVYGAFVQVDGTEESFFIPVEPNASISRLLPDESDGGIPNIVVGQENVSSTSSENFLEARAASTNVQCFRAAPPCQSITLNAGALDPRATVTNRQTYPATLQVVTVPPLSGPVVSYGEITQRPENWSRPMKLDLSITPVGNGEIQVTLTWDTDADIDLYIEEPDGFELYYGNPTSSNGGFLDVDDIDGFGPENVFYDQAPEEGLYSIRVAHFDGTLPTNYSVTLTQNGDSRTFGGTLASVQEEFDVATFEVRAGTPALSGNEDLVISGRLLDAYSSQPLASAKILLSYYSNDEEGEYTTFSDADGRFTLDVESNVLPDQFLVIASIAGYVPITINIDKSAGNAFSVNESMKKIGPDLLVVEVDPALHHLGDDNYSGSINSQFQRRSEGTKYVRSFNVNSTQLAYSEATLTVTAKGLQNSNKILLNGHQVGILNSSPVDGSFGDVSFSFPTSILNSSNSLEIRSNLNSNYDYDDFEFTNVLIRFSGQQDGSNQTPIETSPAISMRFREGADSHEWLDGSTSKSGVSTTANSRRCTYTQFNVYARVTETAGVGKFINGEVRAYRPLGNHIVSGTPMSEGCPGSIFENISAALTLDQRQYEDTLYDVYIFRQYTYEADLECYITAPIGSSSRLWCGVYNSGWQTFDQLFNEL